MNKEQVAHEFEFIRDKIKEIAVLLLHAKGDNLVDAAFMLGCLHSICNQYSIDLKENGR